MTSEIDCRFCWAYFPDGHFEIGDNGKCAWCGGTGKETIVVSEIANDSMLVAWIRAKCAREFKCDRAFQFFSAHYEDDETPDESILRVFREEREAHPESVSDDKVLMIMIHG